MEGYRIKSILSKMFMGGLFVAMVLENATGRSAHNSVISKSVKDGLENNASAIQAEFANLREEILKLSFHLSSEVSARMAQNKMIQSILAAEITARNGQDNVLQSSIDSINAKPRFAAEIRPSSSNLDLYLPRGDITDFNEMIDVGNNFNPKTGRLTINDEDQDGNYVLHVNAWKTAGYGKIGMIHVFKNQKEVQRLDSGDDENNVMMNVVFTLHLQKGDEVKLDNYDDESIYVSNAYPFTFTGYKI